MSVEWRIVDFIIKCISIVSVKNIDGQMSAATLLTFSTLVATTTLQTSNAASVRSFPRYDYGKISFLCKKRAIPGLFYFIIRSLLFSVNKK